VLWPNPRSLTVWTGEDWFAVTVMPVAFGRWGMAVCRDEVPRRAEPFELVGRARTEADARDRSNELAGRVLFVRQRERVVLRALRAESKTGERPIWGRSPGLSLQGRGWRRHSGPSVAPSCELPQAFDDGASSDD
jgi:hypothetical protein